MNIFKFIFRFTLIEDFNFTRRYFIYKHMKIPSSIIKEYLHEKFESFLVNNQEFLVDSIFVEDKKKHMSINMGTGLWQDFKSKETGNFPQLISHIEGISEQEAHKYVGRKLFDSPEALFDVSTVRQESISNSQSEIDEEFKNFKKLEYFISFNFRLPIGTSSI